MSTQIESEPPRLLRRPGPSNREAVVEFIVGLMDVYSGGSPHFDEQATRALAERDLTRTRSVGSCLINHFVIDVGDSDGEPLEPIAAPTLVVHGARDPVFPLPHGEALRRMIPGTELLGLGEHGPRAAAAGLGRLRAGPAQTYDRAPRSRGGMSTAAAIRPVPIASRPIGRWSGQALPPV